eukprot:6011669-Pyramimonas_sp.AAC.1
MEHEARDVASYPAGPAKGEPKEESKGEAKVRADGLSKFGFVDEAGALAGATREDGRTMAAPALLDRTAKR